MEYDIRDRIANAEEEVKLYRTGIISGIILIGGSFILKNPLAFSAGIGLTIGSALNHINYKLNKYNLEENLFLNTDEDDCLNYEIKDNKKNLIFDSIIIGIGTIGCLAPNIILKVLNGHGMSKLAAYTIAFSASFIPATINEIGRAKTLKKFNKKAKKDI